MQNMQLKTVSCFACHNYSTLREPSGMIVGICKLTKLVINSINNCNNFQKERGV